MAMTIRGGFERSRRSGYSLTLAIALSLATGCKTVDPGLEAQYEKAQAEFAIGNYLDAAETYRAVGARFQANRDERLPAALARAATSLERLARFEDASRAFAAIRLEELPVPERAEALLSYANAELQLGYRIEPVFVVLGAETDSEIRDRKSEASRHYSQARNRYNRVLTTCDPDDFDALLGYAESLFRLGLVSENSNFFHSASEAVRRCAQKRPDEKRVLFLSGRLTQEELGAKFENRRQLTERAAIDITKALLVDRERNHDFHLAYRDVLLYLRQFQTRSKLEAFDRDFQAKFGKDEALQANIERLIDLLEEYWRTGHQPPGDPWCQEIRDQAEKFLKEFHRWAGDSVFRDLEAADRTIRSVKEGRFYLDAYEEAMRILERIPRPFWDRPEYSECRRTVQRGYVKTLFQSAERLVATGAFDVALDRVQRAADYSMKPYFEGEEISNLIQQGHGLAAECRSLKTWGADRDRIQRLLMDGKIDEARKEFTLLRSRNYSEDVQAVLKQKLEDFQGALSAAEKNPGRIPEVVKLYEQGSRLATVDAERAVEMLSEALRIVTQIDPPPPYSTATLHREIARVLYRNRRHAECRDQLLQLVDFSRQVLDQGDYALLGMCSYHLGELDRACQSFDHIADPRDVPEAEIRMAAGNAYLSAGSLEVAQRYLEASPREDPAVRDSLKRCYRKLAEQLLGSTRGDRKAPLDVLERLLAIEPDDSWARQELGYLLCRLADEDKSLRDFGRAYDLLRAAFDEGRRPRNPREQESLGRLLAFFESYVPLAVGNRWTYVSSDPANPRRYSCEVIRQKSEGAFEVAFTGEKPRTETWWLEDTILKQWDSENKTGVEFPVQLRWPGSGPIASRSFVAPENRQQAEARIVSLGETCDTGYGVYENCLRVRLDYGEADATDFYFAPGVGQVMQVRASTRMVLAEKVIVGSERTRRARAVDVISAPTS